MSSQSHAQSRLKYDTREKLFCLVQKKDKQKNKQIPKRWDCKRSTTKLFFTTFHSARIVCKENYNKKTYKNKQITESILLVLFEVEKSNGKMQLR